MTDTPVTPPTFPPMLPLEQAKVFIGDLARPFAIIVSAASAAIATVVIAFKVTSFSEAALFIGAVWAGVGALYGAKAWENARAGKQEADVKIAKATASVQPDSADGSG